VCLCSNFVYKMAYCGMTFMWMLCVFVCVFSALPYVRQYDRPKNVIEGDPFHSECYAWGYPPVTVVWHRDTALIVADANRVVFKNGSVENSTLRIEDVHYEDSADYTCIATNALGSVNATISVDVKGAEFSIFFLKLITACAFTGMFVNNKSHCQFVLSAIRLSFDLCNNGVNWHYSDLFSD